MKAVSLVSAGNAQVVHIPEPEHRAEELLSKVAMVGLCGTDLNSFHGRNPLVTYPLVIEGTMVEAGPFPVERAASALVSLPEAPRVLAHWASTPAAFTKIMVQV